MFAGTPPQSPSVLGSVVTNNQPYHPPLSPTSLHFDSSLPPSPHIVSHPKHLQPWETSHQTTSTTLPAECVRVDTASSYRSDGRRHVDLEHSPALNQASKLYGEPSWWGEEKDAERAAKEREKDFFKPNTQQILRDMDHEGYGMGRKEKESVPFKLSNKDELRMQAISNMRSQDCATSNPPSSVTSWVIDLRSGSTGGAGGGGGTPKIRRSREIVSRPRSADPSPNRLRVKRDVSPLPSRPITPNSPIKRRSTINSPVSTRNSTPTSLSPTHRHRGSTPPVTPQSPVRRRHGTTPPVGSITSPIRRHRSITSPRHTSPARSGSPAQKQGSTLSHRNTISSSPSKKPVVVDDEGGNNTMKKRRDNSLTSTSKVQATPPKNATSKLKPSNHLKNGSNTHLSRSKSLNCKGFRHSSKVTTTVSKPVTAEKTKSESPGERTYVVGVSDDSSSMSSLSEPSTSSVSDQAVVVTAASLVKARNAESAEKKSEGEEEQGSTQTRSVRKEWIDDDVQVCACMLMCVCAYACVCLCMHVCL